MAKKNQIFGISPQSIMELSDLHDLSINSAVDICLDGVKESLKMVCNMMKKNRKYPVKYKIGNKVIFVDEKGNVN